MDILFVVPYVPNLIRVRPYNLIRYLSGRGHRITLFTLWSDEQEREALDDLKKYCTRVEAERLPRWRSLWNCLLALPTARPLQAVYCWQPNLAEKLHRLAAARGGKAPFDVMHVEHLRGAEYGLHMKKVQPDFPVVWDSVDCISLLFRRAALHSKKRTSRMVTRFELQRTETYEGWLLGRFNHTLVTSPADRDALVSLGAPGEAAPPVTVLPNGVDLDYFIPHTTERREPATLVISGKMSYHANVTMTLYLTQSIMPLIWARRPDVKLWIVGKDPAPEIQALREHPSITVTGTVSDIRPYLQQATIAVAPLTYGVGIQNKILEALSCATPVITTPQAVSALGVKPGREVLVAQDPEVFARQVLQLLGDPQQQHRVGQAGRLYVEAHHKWETIAAQLEGAYHDLVNTDHRSPARAGPPHED
jgi:sugar transferase (PEP-CTERM/EpsH1 system associated)